MGGIIGASCFGNKELTDSGSLIEKCVNEGTITGEKGKREHPCIWVELSAMLMGPSFQTVRVR